MAGGYDQRNTICSAKSPSSATVVVREGAEAGADEQIGAELLAGPDHLDGLLLAEGEGDAAHAGVLGAEDELGEVGGAGRDGHVERERGASPA